MGLEYYFKKTHNEDEFPSFSSDNEIPLYPNTSHNHCPSPSSSKAMMTKTYIDPHTYASIRNHTDMVPSKQIACHLPSIYVNIPILPSKPTNISNEVTYATLMNTTSHTPLINTDSIINHAHYQQIAIQQTVDKNNNNPIYENMIPSEVNQSLSHSEKLTTPVIPPIYINLQNHENKSPVISTPSSKTDQKEDNCFSLLTISISSIEKEHGVIETNVLEPSSNDSIIQTVKQLEVNMAPSCSDKSDLYRTKMSMTMKQILPSFTNTRQRRTIRTSKRRHSRNSLTYRGSIKGSINSNSMRRRQQQQRSNHHVSTRHPMIPDDRYRRPLIKKQQPKLNGNVTRLLRSVSNQIYNEISQPILPSNQSDEEESYISEHTSQSTKAFRDRVSAWYRSTTNNEHVFSTSENEESYQKNVITNEEETEEFFTHEKFEDFLLRRRPESSYSNSTSDSTTVVSHEGSQQSSDQTPPPPPPRPTRRCNGIALGLDKTDVDFIHNIIQRTQGDDRVSNRITALKEAYIRATDKMNDLPKIKTNLQVNQKKKIPMKHSFIATKIRNELRNYDELPAHRRIIRDYEDDDDDDTYSANDDHRFDYNSRHALPSTTDRILNFAISLKRRARTSVQLIQKNFQDIIEAMTISSQRHTLHNTSGVSHRHVSRVKHTHNTVVRRTDSHESGISAEHSNALHRQQLHATHSNSSRLQQQSHLPSFERHPSRKPQAYRMTSHHQRLRRID